MTTAQLRMLAYTLLFAGQHTHTASGLPPFKVAKDLLECLAVDQTRRSAMVYHLEAIEAAHRERFKDKPNRPSPLRPRTLILLLLLEVRSMQQRLVAHGGSGSLRGPPDTDEPQRQ